MKFWYLEVMKDRTSGLRLDYLAAVALFTLLFITLGCTQLEKNHEFKSGQFVVSTTVKGTGVTIYDSLYVDRYTNDSIYIFGLELFGRLEDGQVRVPKQIKVVRTPLITSVPGSFVYLAPIVCTGMLNFYPMINEILWFFNSND